MSYYKEWLIFAKSKENKNNEDPRVMEGITILFRFRGN